MDYYSEKLSGERLRRCYEVASPRVKAFLEAEIDFAYRRIEPGDLVLDLGCGYGRLLPRLEARAGRVVGIDSSLGSLRQARDEAAEGNGRWLAAMNAVRLGFPDGCFDAVLCLQNGISAFHEDPLALIAEALRVTASPGRVLFSSYAEAFWEQRLAWFEIQADHGLVGEIDRARTGNGVIVGKDGFTATTARPEDFERWAGALGVAPELTEVDGSSLFCELVVE